MRMGWTKTQYAISGVWLLLIVVSLISLFVAFYRQTHITPLPQPQTECCMLYEYRAKITRVIDGDTFEAEVDLGFNTRQDHTFRLYGIDTPETRKNSARGVGLKQVQHGLAAKARVEELIGPKEGRIAGQGPFPRTFTIRTWKDKTGKYGRWLADVHIPAPHKGIGFENLTEILRSEGFSKRENYHEDGAEE